MIPLYKHIIQPIEASFLQAYEVTGKRTLTTAIVIKEASSGESHLPGGESIQIPVKYLYSGTEEINGETYFTWTSNKGKTVYTFSNQLEASDVFGLLMRNEVVFNDELQIIFDVEKEEEDVLGAIPYFALLINKDDERQKVQLPSHIHIIDESNPETNDNALVYFEIGEAGLHDFNEGDKLIFEIYRDDRKGYWTSKSPAFKVFETSIDDTEPISLQEGGQDE